MKPTVKTIAQKLGVSPSAVSFALNGKSGISDETRERILAELKRCGYQKKKAMPSLNRHIRYVIFCNNDRVVQETSFSSLVLQGIEEIGTEYGSDIIVSYFDASKNWDTQIRSMGQGVSGLIILATEVHDEDIQKALHSEAMKELKLPLVLVDNATTLTDIDCIVAGNLDGAYKAVSSLFALGHPDVGYLRSVERIDNFDERRAGYDKARRAAGIGDEVPPCVIDVGISSDQAFEDMNRWLEEGNKPPSALFAENDFIALSAMRALKNHGYRIPEDVSVAGFDDMPFSSMSEPPLTTVRITKEQIGRLAMHFLLERILQTENGVPKRPLSPVRVTVSADLMIRETTSPYKNQP